MNIDKLKSDILTDLAMDDTSLDSEAIRVAQLHNKYAIMLMDAKLVLQKWKSNRNQARLKAWRYYTGKMDVTELASHGLQPFQHRILKNDVYLYIDADPEVIKAEDKLAAQEQIVWLLEVTLKAINQRPWSIRAAIDWRKFMGGVS